MQALCAILPQGLYQNGQLYEQKGRAAGPVFRRE